MAHQGPENVKKLAAMFDAQPLLDKKAEEIDAFIAEAPFILNNQKFTDIRTGFRNMEIDAEIENEFVIVNSSGSTESKKEESTSSGVFGYIRSFF